MRRDEEYLLTKAIDAVRMDVPTGAQLNASAKRIAGQLGLDPAQSRMVETIDSCEDVRKLRALYKVRGLSLGRAQLIEAHLQDCGACHRIFNDGDARVDWSAPKVAHSAGWPRANAWVYVPVMTALVCLFFVYKMFWQIPPGVRAEVQSVDGAAYRISGTGDHRLAAGDTLAEGDEVRTGGSGHAVLKLADGSTVEVNERSMLGVGARGRNMTIALDNGAVIVQATKRDAGHLYVNTPDCRVAVTGTVFTVNSGIKGSRVAVLEGSLHVDHAGRDKFIRAGEQIETSENLNPEPVSEQIAWSADKDRYVSLLAQFDVLQHRIEAIPAAPLRYSSDLLQRVPADTLLYVSIPNFGDFLSQANTIFLDQLQQSPVLRQWWESGRNGNSAEMTQLVDKLAETSRYLGNELVVVGVQDKKNPGFAVIADVEKSGLPEFLQSQFPASSGKPAFVVLNEASLRTAPHQASTEDGAFALVREHEVIFSNRIATLARIDAQLNAGNSGFASSDFGQQINAAYGRGAGLILAADLHSMINKPIRNSAKTAMEDVRYWIAEHREVNGSPENHLNLQFAGTRTGVASWLAAPAPIGSLEFVTPNASIAVALLSKDPAAIADDIISMTSPADAEKAPDGDATLKQEIRDEIATNLGGDFLLALDGPVLPTPSWKAVIEVRDPAQMEKTLEHLTEVGRDASSGEPKEGIEIQSSSSGGQEFFSIQRTSNHAEVGEYTFADGYMILAANRALLMAAMHARKSGNSLARSEDFKALLPKDDNANYSAVAYQNLRPILATLLPHLSGQAADTLQMLASDAKPTAVCAWGKDNRIEAASDSHLFGFDFLTLAALMHPGNKEAAASVPD